MAHWHFKKFLKASRENISVDVDGVFICNDAFITEYIKILKLWCGSKKLNWYIILLDISWNYKNKKQAQKNLSVRLER